MRSAGPQTMIVRWLGPAGPAIPPPARRRGRIAGRQFGLPTRAVGQRGLQAKYRGAMASASSTAASSGKRVRAAIDRRLAQVAARNRSRAGSRPPLQSRSRHL
jgi:hypothetical protein